MEYWGVLFLLCKGYSLLAMRKKSPFGEIDAIFYYRGQCILCEIKYRRQYNMGEIPISGQQIAYYHRALPWALRKYNFTNGRVDGLVIGKFLHITHIKNLLMD